MGCMDYADTIINAEKVYLCKMVYEDYAYFNMSDPHKLTLTQIFISSFNLIKYINLPIGKKTSTAKCYAWIIVRILPTY